MSEAAGSSPQGASTESERYSAARSRRRDGTRHHSDGHAVTTGALPDYDALFGVDFTYPSTTKARTA
jgi:hypothetical protein